MRLSCSALIAGTNTAAHESARCLRAVAAALLQDKGQKGSHINPISEIRTGEVVISTMGVHKVSPLVTRRAQ